MRSKLQIEVEKIEDRHANSNRCPGSVCEATPKELKHLQSIAFKKSPKYKKPKRRPKKTTIYIHKNGIEVKQVLNYLNLDPFQLSYRIKYHRDHAWKLIIGAINAIKDGHHEIS